MRSASRLAWPEDVGATVRPNHSAKTNELHGLGRRGGASRVEGARRRGRGGGDGGGRGRPRGRRAPGGGVRAGPGRGARRGGVRTPCGLRQRACGELSGGRWPSRPCVGSSWKRIDVASSTPWQLCSATFGR